MTEYEYDDAGRLVRSVTTRDPLWTEQDRAEALALTLYRERSCPCGCGNPASLTLIPEDKGPAWEVTHTTCTARLALLERQRAAVEKYKTKNADAWLWSVRPRKR